MYCHTAKNYINKLIRIRTRLINDGTNRKNTMQMASDIDFLKKHLEAYTYTNRTMAMFFIRNAVKIHELIPVYSGGYNSLIEEYKELYAQAYKIINQKVNV
jgi:hypothetical protein